MPALLPRRSACQQLPLSLLPFWIAMQRCVQQGSQGQAVTPAAATCSQLVLVLICRCTACMGSCRRLHACTRAALSGDQDQL